MRGKEVPPNLPPGEMKGQKRKGEQTVPAMAELRIIFHSFFGRKGKGKKTGLKPARCVPRWNKETERGTRKGNGSW